MYKTNTIIIGYMQLILECFCYLESSYADGLISDEPTNATQVGAARQVCLFPTPQTVKQLVRDRNEIVSVSPVEEGTVELLTQLCGSNGAGLLSR